MVLNFVQQTEKKKGRDSFFSRLFAFVSANSRWRLQSTWNGHEFIYVCIVYWSPNETGGSLTAWFISFIEHYIIIDEWAFYIHFFHHYCPKIVVHFMLTLFLHVKRDKMISFLLSIESIKKKIYDFFGRGFEKSWEREVLKREVQKNPLSKLAFFRTVWVCFVFWSLN